MPPAAEKDQILYGKQVKISLHFSSLSSETWAGSHEDDDDDDDGDDDNVDRISSSIL
jgi:hypothetical protein